MQMVTGGPAGGPYITQHRSLGYLCSDLIQRRTIHVRIHGGKPIGVLYLDHVAIGGIVAGLGNRTIGGTVDTGPTGSRNINTGMVTLFLTGNRMSSVPEVG